MVVMAGVGAVGVETESVISVETWASAETATEANTAPVKKAATRRFETMDK